MVVAVGTRCARLPPCPGPFQQQLHLGRVAGGDDRIGSIGGEERLSLVRQAGADAIAVRCDDMFRQVLARRR